MKKRREFTAELKAKICLQILTGSKSTAQICRENQLNENLGVSLEEAVYRERFHGL